MYNESEYNGHFKWVYLIQKIKIFSGLLGFQNQYVCISMNPQEQPFEIINDKKNNIDLYSGIPSFPNNENEFSFVSNESI